MPMKEYKSLDPAVSVFAFTDADAITQFADHGVNILDKKIEVINHLTRQRETRTIK